MAVLFFSQGFLQKLILHAELGKHLLQPRGYVFIAPQMHRIHHSLNKKHWNHNLSQYFTFWDSVFGTLYIAMRYDYPGTGAMIDIGIFSNYLPSLQAKNIMGGEEVN